MLKIEDLESSVKNGVTFYYITGIARKHKKNITNWKNSRSLERLINSEGLTLSCELNMDIVDITLVSEKIVNHFLSWINKGRVARPSNIVYVITDGLFTKIGITNSSTAKRLKQLQTGNPNKLTVEKEITTMHADDIEKRLHIKYSDKRMCGEWFNLSPKEIDDVKSTLAELEFTKRN